jgi:hypothetical protein
MFCPKCATQNLDGASFCRSCGANISLIPQALAGQLQEAEKEEGGSCFTGKPQKEVGLDQSFRNIFLGIAFFLVALALAYSIGRGWWFWLLLPAFSMLGTGVAQYIRWRDNEKKRALGAPQVPRAFAQPTTARELPRRNTGELMAPVASVTEGTTRHLGAEAPTRHIGEESRR